MTISSVGALLLISENAAELADFYSNVLELPMEDEVHEGVPIHYGCEIGNVHFAIHPSETWPGVSTRNSQSPVIVFNTPDAKYIFDKLRAHQIAATPPFDHGFAILVSFRDPDGNNVQVMQLPH